MGWSFRKITLSEGKVRLEGVKAGDWETNQLVTVETQPRNDDSLIWGSGTEKGAHWRGIEKIELVQLNDVLHITGEKELLRIILNMGKIC